MGYAKCPKVPIRLDRPKKHWCYDNLNEANGLFITLFHVSPQFPRVSRGISAPNVVTYCYEVNDTLTTKNKSTIIQNLPKYGHFKIQGWIWRFKNPGTRQFRRPCIVMAFISSCLHGVTWIHHSFSRHTLEPRGAYTCNWVIYWFRSWIIAWKAPSHYLKQCWITITLYEQTQMNFDTECYSFARDTSICSQMC